MSLFRLKNGATNQESKAISLQSAVNYLLKLKLTEAKNFYISADGTKKVWQNVFENPTILKALLGTPEADIFETESPAESAPVESNSAEEAAVAAAVEVQEVEAEVLEHTQEIEVAEQTLPETLQETAHSTKHEAVEVEPEPTAPTVSANQQAEKRSHPRFDAKFRVLVKSAHQTFLTYTQDVSLGGLSLLHEVPENVLNENAEVYITAPDRKNSIMFKCLPVGNGSSRSRLMFTNIEPAKQQLVASWIEHFVQTRDLKKVS